MLVPSPHRVPRFERDQHEIHRARLLPALGRREARGRHGRRHPFPPPARRERSRRAAARGPRPASASRPGESSASERRRSAAARDRRERRALAGRAHRGSRCARPHPRRRRVSPTDIASSTIRPRPSTGHGANSIPACASREGRSERKPRNVTGTPRAAASASSAPRSAPSPAISRVHPRSASPEAAKARMPRSVRFSASSRWAMSTVLPRAAAPGASGTPECTTVLGRPIARATA